MTAGENNLTLDAGIFIQGREPASIGNYVWYDADTDGIQDSGESGLSGINVNLINPVTGEVLATAKTDTGGYYEFAGLAPGDYIVQFEPPAGYTFTSVNQGADDSLDSDANQSTGKTEIISLKSGDKNTNTDAGLYAPDTITIGDLVWLDKNNDGSPNTGEGIAGVTLMLFDGNGSLLETAITDKNGNYSFQYLPHGDYRITVDTGTLPEGVYEFSDPDGVTDSATDLINQSDDNLNADFGYRTGSIASLGNFVWYDTNENGIQDASEKGVAGITVNLINPATGKIFDTASTDGAGFYEFKELTPGKYIVEFVIPAGYVFSPQNEGSGALQDAFDSDTDTVTGRTAQVTLSAGDRNLTLDAGIFVPDTEPASLGDYVWYDTNENGIQDKDENGISGVTVRLINPVNEEILASTVTDGSGLYRFEGLIPGDYAVEFELPPDYRFTAQNQGSDEASESDADTVTGRTAQVTLIAGENNLNIDAGMFISGTKPAGIGNYVWYDNDRDGLQDEDEHGFAGVTVELYDGTGAVLIASAKADSNGYYEFSGLVPGDYIVKFDVPSGYRLTDRNQGNDDSLDSDANPSTGKTGIITVAAGEIVTHADAGLSAFNPITIGDLIWLDMNYDGKPNAGEGIPGITVMLYDGNGVLFDTTVTDENGNYNFTELPPGDYRVTVDTDTLPEGAEIFSDPDDTEDSSADLINLSADKLDADFGYHLLKASLGNFVWYDLNQNGIQDASEKGVSGIKVNLINPATGKVIDTTTTDGSGFYEFTELNAGDYAVEFVPPAGYLFTPRNKGTGELQDAFDSDADTETGRTAQVTLSAGDRNLTLDAGIFVPDTEPASLGDYVWYDTNENGIQDNGENGISNVTVRLINPLTEEILAVTATDGSGLYSFEGLMPGDYAVEFELPDDYRFTVKNQGADTRYDSNADELTGRTEQVTLSGGENNLNIDAGMFIPDIKPASIGDYVWYDNDRDGLQDEYEHGFSGVTVELYDSTGNILIASVKTDTDGYYAFSGIIHGDYIVKFDVPSGYRLSNRNQGNDDSVDSDANQSTGKTGIITVAAGESIIHADAGLFAFNPITIGDLVWLDINGNGSPNSNEGISGVTVMLSDGNGILIATAITDNNGNYSFTGLPPGDYRITVDTGTLPEGITEYSDPDGDPDSMTDLMNQRVDNLNADFGYRKLLDASIGDFVWYDVNENGIRDSGEKGVEDVTVYLIDPLSNEVLAATTTNSVGFYGFSGLTPDDYIVEFVLPENYQFTIQNHETNDFMDSNANPVTGRTEIITLSSGENNLTIDAGILLQKTESASLGDYVWYDADHDGVQDDNEHGVANVTVNLLNPSTGKVIATTETNVNGFYQFTGLNPGNYAVGFVLPEGYEFTPQNHGNDDFADSDADTETGLTAQVTLTAGEHNPTLDAGIFTPYASIGDYVWYDANHNGIQDADEKGVAGVTVKLVNQVTGEIIKTAVTDSKGFYQFTDLNPGDYAVQFILPDGYEFTSQNQGNNDSSDSDADMVTGRTAQVTLTAGEHNPTLDAGIFTMSASLGDYVWYDANQNGIQDADEKGAAGVKVNLINQATGEVISSAFTDSKGFYLFTNLNPGNYAVEFVLPEGCEFTSQNQGNDDSSDSDADTETGLTAQVTLAAGEHNPSLDAGIFTPYASIGDYVWYDANQNGIQDADEKGVAGVTVKLVNPANGEILDTEVTNVSGFYQFTGLNPGNYAVGFVLPEGYEFTPQNHGNDDFADSDADTETGRTAQVTLTAGEHNPTLDAGIFTSLASLGDYVWYDSNQNGVQDADEKGVAGVKVNLINPATGEVIVSAVTDSKGFYLFTNLNPGNYAVEFVLPEDYEFTSQNHGNDDSSDSDADTGTGRTAQVTLTAGEHNPTLDAGIFTMSASLGDYVWYDANQNGIQDADEKGVAGVTVRLINPATGVIIATALTNVNGFYQFTGLNPGNYAVEFVLPEGYEFTPQNHGNDDFADSDADTETGRTGQVTLAAGEHNPSLDAGIFTPYASIGDYVWYDANHNGIQDADEKGVAGVTVKLVNPATGEILDTEVTNVSGFYQFTGLNPGNYAVGFVLPEGYEFTPQNHGNDDFADSDADTETGLTAQVTLTAGEHNPTLDAGIFTSLASLGDYVWYDSNQNGVQDADEKGVAGVKVNLINPATGEVIVSAVTDSKGFYLFTNLNPGNYAVEFVLPEGYEFTPQNHGNDDFADSDADTETGRTGQVTLAAGEHNPSLDAGIFTPYASIGDYVWYDANHNGIQDADEKGVAGVTVKLVNPANGEILDTEVTNVSGFYQFTGLNPGNYAVEFVLPEDYEFTSQNHGNDDSSDSDADTVTGRTSQVTLTAGEHNPTLDAGIFSQFASLGDYVWYDTNQNGVQDAGESGVSGVTVKLVNQVTGEIIKTAVTDSKGFYQFTDLNPGDYAVQFILPDGYEFTSQNQGNNDSSDSDADTVTGRTPQVTLTAGEHNPTLDAGIFTPLANLGDYVWYDANQNGIQDADEKGVAGVTVKLVNPANGEILDTEVTNVSGFYQFTGLNPGNYAVEFVLPEGYEFTPQNHGNDDFADSDADTETGLTAQVTLTAGEHNPTLDAGIFTMSASLGDYVWYDANQNGVQDAGENGVAGVKVNLINPATGEVIVSAVTDSKGFYLFTNLNPGNYAVEFVLPEGYEFTPQNHGNDDFADSDADTETGLTAQVTLTAGEHNPTLDAGIFSQFASLGDYVWYDTNQNGVQDAGESGVSGVTVKLVNQVTGEIIKTAVTDSKGFYQFTDLNPGDYAVQFILPDGYEFTSQNQGNNDSSDSDADMVTGRTAQVTLTAGEHNPTLDAGIFTMSAILGDYVWYDANQNGVQDADEKGAAGVKVNLINPATGEVIVSAVTDSKGFYLFTNLNPGNYAVEFVLPEDYEFTSQNHGNDDSSDSDADTETGRTAQVTLTAGEHNPTLDAGIFTMSASLGDYVWYDSNQNGVQDADEKGVAGVKVNLINPATGEVIVSAVTDSKGFYLFTNLNPGNYAVEFVLPEDYEFTSQNHGNDDSSDSDADTGTGRTAQVTLTAGEHNPTLDAGIFTMSASLGDYVWYDANQNGVQDAGEKGAAGVKVNLINPATGEVIVSAVTDSKGFYLFTNLNPGNYAVEFVLPEGYEFTSQNHGNDDSSDSDADTVTGRTSQVTLTAGEHNPTLDAGIFVPYASLGDYIWLDANHNGIQDADEKGVAGVTVRLINPATGVIIATALTNVNGFYQFTGLVPGDYAVEFVLPEGYEFTLQNHGNDDSSDSDADTVTGRTAQVTLKAGEHNPTIDAGIFVPYASLGDYIWLDANHNGIQDADEKGAAGVTVRLINPATGEIIVTTLTNVNGFYQFTGLNPGNYAVEFVLPEDYDFTSQNHGNDDSSDSDADTETGRTGQVTLTAGEHNPTLDAGIFTMSAILGDYVWYDANQNGVQDADEKGVAGVTVKLVNPANGEILDTEVTNVSGFYQFTGLNPGNYAVEFVLPEGYEFTPQNHGNDDFADSDADTETGRTGQVTLAAGEHNPTIDAGIFVPYASIGDYVWLDANHNGIQDADENGISGITVNLINQATGEIIATTQTDANGYYLFDKLNKGEYQVAFELPSGYVFTYSYYGTDNNLDSNADPYTGLTEIIRLEAGEHNRTVDAGVYEYNTLIIGDFVWLDMNNDQQPTTGEGIPNITLILLDGSGNIIATTVTDENGYYSFTGLIPGDYQIKVDTTTLPEGIIQYFDPDGESDNTTYITELISDRLDADFGYQYENKSVFPDLTNTVKAVLDINGGELEPGDVVWYAVAIYNSGNDTARGVIYTDNLDPNTSLIPGFVITAQGTVESGNNPDDKSVKVNIGSVAPGKSVVIKYLAQISKDAPEGIWIKNQGIVTGINFPDEPTDMADTVAINDSTVIGTIGNLISDIDLKAEKTAKDLNGGELYPNDIVEYEIHITNSGAEAAANLIFTDSVPVYTTLIPGSLTAGSGVAAEGNPVQVKIEKLDAESDRNNQFQSKDKF